MKPNIIPILAAVALFLIGSPAGSRADDEGAPRLPDDLVWLTNDSDPVFASPEAEKGGTFHEAILSFPPTFRVVGPDSNSSFRGMILSNQLSLIGIHPNTERVIPEIATHWAAGS